MGLIEAITRELLHEVKDVSGGIRLHTPAHRPLHEDGSLLCHFCWLFLAHGTT